MKKMLDRLTWIPLFALALALAAGCDRAAAELSELEARERTTRLYSNAMDDYRAGRLDAAIKGFERVVLDEPKSYSAHFQLATLLQDVRKDYIGAIAHYRAYMALRPASDKATVAVDRERLCESALLQQVAAKTGPGQLKADNERLAAERDELAAKVKKLEGDCAAAQAKIANLERSNESQHRLLMKLARDDESTGPRKNVAQEAKDELRRLEADDARKRTRPTDAELLDDEPAEGDRIRASADVAKLRAVLDREDQEDVERARAKAAQGPSPAATNAPPQAAFDGMFGGAHAKKPKAASTRPSTYVIAEGDTLIRISERFYGSRGMWRSIRDANRTVIRPDGRVRVGQTIKLP